MVVRTIVAMALLVVTMPCGATESASTNSSCAIVDFPVAERPMQGGPPTMVRLGVAVIDLLKIDDREQQVVLDLMANLAWTDPRLERFAGCRVMPANI